MSSEIPLCNRCIPLVCRLSTQRHSRHYLPFLTMSSDMEWSGGRSIIAGPNANRVDQSPDIVFSVFSALQTIEEAKQLVSRLVAPRSAVRRGCFGKGPLLHSDCGFEIPQMCCSTFAVPRVQTADSISRQ
jgi:hypothetical protein